MDETDSGDGFLNDKRYLLTDRDTKSCKSFRGFLAGEGVEPVRLPAGRVNLNVHLEPVVKGPKSERLNDMIFFGENSLLKVVREYPVSLSHRTKSSRLGKQDD